MNDNGNQQALLKIDIGCGAKKYKGPKGDQNDWIGIDQHQFDGVDWRLDVGTEKWPFADASVAEAYSAHFVEHLTAIERIHFVNELHRVLVPGGKCQLVVPSWTSGRAYGDPTHQWPPVSGMWFYYLSREWRLDEGNAPHTDVKHWPQGYSCDFECTWGHGMHPLIAARNTEAQQFALQFYIEAAQDIHACLIKR